uniref:Uncharacterized protein n=1 Tax=Arcella intermedia TaxID=1963864 RepID=A0A6B2LLG3_9EUKA
MCGNSGVGKSSVLLRFADNTFTERFISTIGIDFKIRTIDIDGAKIKLQIWDTAGQERFRTITSSYYRGSHAVLMVYDITDRHSYTEISSKWMSEVSSYASPDVLRAMVGNKCDLASSRAVETSEAQELATSLGVMFAETSAKTAVNVEQLFTDVARSLWKKTTVK